MIRRLMEAHYFQNRGETNLAHIRFWLQELRTPELLIEVARSNAARCRRLVAARPLLKAAIRGDSVVLARALEEEEAAERKRDELYWLPLRRELESLRHPT
jgi:hypothetical protein